VSVSSMGALRHGGRWESGHVRVGIGMRCIPACATTAIAGPSLRLSGPPALRITLDQRYPGAAPARVCMAARARTHRR
jgi:hypothetical protein